MPVRRASSSSLGQCSLKLHSAAVLRGSGMCKAGGGGVRLLFTCNLYILPRYKTGLQV